MRGYVITMIYANSQLSYSIRNNQMGNQQRILKVLLSGMRSNSDYKIVLSSYVPLQKYLRRKRTLPFTLTDISKCEKGYTFLFRLLSNEARPVLIIHRYRCPGPMAEIMVAVKQLKSRQKMDLWLFGEKVDQQGIESSLKQRDFRVEQAILLSGGFYKSTISRKEFGHAV